MSIVTKKFIMVNKIGLHARPAAKFVKLTTMLSENHIWIENLTKNSSKVNAKSFIMVLSISVEQNDEIQITIEDPDGNNILNEFQKFFTGLSGEKE